MMYHKCLATFECDKKNPQYIQKIMDMCRAAARNKLPVYDSIAGQAGIAAGAEVVDGCVVVLTQYKS